MEKERDGRLRRVYKGYDVAAFVRRARSAFFDEKTGKALSTIETFRQWAAFCPGAGEHWQKRARALEERQIMGIVNRIPGERMAELCKRFALEMVKCNREAVLGAEIR